MKLLKSSKLAMFTRNEKGVTMIEYALIAALIAVAAVAILATVGTDITNIFTTVSGKLK